MAEAPELDGRRAEAIRAEIADLAPYYTEQWDPDAGGVGAGLVDVFAELGAEVTERLDAAPAKHRIAFFETVGFAARPPQAARVPIQYTLAPEAPRNVAVRAGTAAIAAAGEEVTVQVAAGDAFEATPARLTDVVAVHPEDDAIYEHGDVIDGGGELRPWTGADEQAHEWYIGDADLLSAGAGDEIVVDLDTAVDPDVLVDEAEWHYYGTDGEDGPETWRRIDEPDPDAVSQPVGDLAITLRPDGPLVEYAVDGVESKWLRCRLPAGTAPTGDRHFEVTTVGITSQSGGDGIDPDAMLANDVPQQNAESGEEPITPFGDRPRPGDTFYIGSRSAFSKADATVTLTMTPTGTDGQTATDGSGDLFREAESGPSKTVEKLDLPADIVEQIQAAADRGGDPSLSWEYWDGAGWSRLELDTNETDALIASEPADVTFDVPTDLAPTTVAGHEGHWIRVRLVGGDYGSTIQVPQDDEGTRWAQQFGGSPPEFEAITVSYEVTSRSLPAHVRTHNALAATDHEPTANFRPFRQLPEATQTLYLGFDKALSGGPLQLFARVDEHQYPPTFTPRLQWERRHSFDPGWIQPDVRDDTAGLTEQGLVGFGFREATRATARFGRERHWLRARVTDEPFEPESDEASDDEDSVDSDDSNGDGAGLGTCGDAVDTKPPGGEQSKRPPNLRGLYMNTGWARNVDTIEGELLGGSDGERDQTFAVANPPAVDATVWVDELNSLSEPQREQLRDSRPGDVEIERTTDGAVRAFWVRWEEVPDLLDSGSDARHFAVDATAGEVRFGDGTRGRIPPRGTDNVRADYRTGGGDAGNVPEGAVGELKSGLPFVDRVTNPAPGAGGADTESTAAVLERAPQELKDRGRAVMPADYERIAADASRRVARAECIPAMDGDGTYAPGFVTVLVVPQAREETPIPSLGLLDRVETVLEEHAPVSVVEAEQLIVRGPSYVDVGVDADVVAGDVGSLNALENRLREAIEAFLHPLSGGDGGGWDFGALPTRSDCFALLEGLEGVDHVESLFLHVDGTETIEVGEGDPQPAIAADALVRGGTHDLTLELGGDG